MGRLRRGVVAVGVSALVLAGISGCTYITDALAQKTTLKENLEYQRITAVNHQSRWPNVDEITFTQEGSIAGSGAWAANAIVTIDGTEYREIIGPYSGGGDAMPLPSPGLVPGPLTVNFSDGTSEVLE